MNQFNRRSLLAAGAAIVSASSVGLGQERARQIGNRPLAKTRTRFAANLEM